MEARVGDRLIVLGKRVGQAATEGEIVEVMGDSGGQHYRVRWSDGRETVMYPGTDVRIEHAVGDDTPVTRRSLTIELRFDEDRDRCGATATMMTAAGTFTGSGHARRHPSDPEVPMIGEELATARALRDLADHLEDAAGRAISDGERRPLHLT